MKKQKYFACILGLYNKFIKFIRTWYKLKDLLDWHTQTLKMKLDLDFYQNKISWCLFLLFWVNGLIVSRYLKHKKKLEQFFQIKFFNSNKNFKNRQNIYSLTQELGILTLVIFTNAKIGNTFWITNVRVRNISTWINNKFEP
jgi:hypothetical protein